MTVVFTAILGTCDSLKPAPKGADRCVCFVDNPSQYPDSQGWELVPYAYAGDPRRAAWHLRCVPHDLFPGYDRSVWIDASFTITSLRKLLKDAGTAPIAALRHHLRRSPYQEATELVKIGQSDRTDVAQQAKAYRAQGFPGRHLSISCILVRDRSLDVQRVNELWRDQIAFYPGDNTQVSLDYSAWVHGITIKALKGRRHQNPYAIHDHDDHKKRRQPYLRPMAVSA